MDFLSNLPLGPRANTQTSFSHFYIIVFKSTKATTPPVTNANIKLELKFKLNALLVYHIQDITAPIKLYY